MPLMNNVDMQILRCETDNEGTFGTLSMKGFCCFTGELPWRNNKPNISHVLPNIYTASIDENTIMGGLPVIRFDENEDLLKGRWGILIHVANFFGDVSMDNKTDVKGCIGVGFGKDELNNQKALLDSKDAMTELLSKFKTDGKITIEIKNLY